MSARPAIDTTTLEGLSRLLGGKHHECGGILGGSSLEHISVYYHDANACCDRNEYRPDAEHLSHVVERWYAKGFFMLGFVHSHPPHVSSLSAADVQYAKEFLRLNETIPGIYMGIVTDDQLFLYLMRRKNSRVPDVEVYVHEKHIYPLSIHQRNQAVWGHKMNEYQQVLTTIRETAGYSELYEFGCKLTALAKQKEESRYNAVLIPNLFVETPAGFSPREFIGLLSNLVNALGLKTPIGEEAFVTEKYKDDEGSLKGLVGKLHQAAGFYGEFNGFVGLQIDPETDIHQLKYLFQLVETQPKMTFVFFVSNTSDERTRKKLAIELMRRVNLHQMKVDRLNTEQMMKYLEEQLKLKGFSFTTEARESIKAVLHDLKNATSFGGCKTLNQLAEHIIWNLIAPTTDHRTISVQDLRFLFERRGFLDSFQEPGTRCIGFGEKG